MLASGSYSISGVSMAATGGYAQEVSLLHIPHSEGKLTVRRPSETVPTNLRTLIDLGAMLARETP